MVQCNMRRNPPGMDVCPLFSRLAAALSILGPNVDALGVRTLLWITFAVNEASVRLAHRYGFVRWGLRPRGTEREGGRKFGRWLDVCLMQCLL